ncbi:hypothetical protein AAHE18_17G195500 [Arachis hypogaea]
MYRQHLNYDLSISSSILIPPLSFPGFHSQVKTPLKTWLFPPSDASHSMEFNTICDSAPTKSLISGLSTGSSCKHRPAISATLSTYSMG